MAKTTRNRGQPNRKQQFAFITVTEPKNLKDRENRRLANAHVMKEITREKKFRSIQRLRYVSAAKVYDSKGLLPKRRSVANTCPLCGLSFKPESQEESSCPSCGTTSPSTGPESTKNETSIIVRMKPSPKTLLSAGKTDPFDSFPVKWTHSKMHYLFDSFSQTCKLCLMLIIFLHALFMFMQSTKVARFYCGITKSILYFRHFINWL
jgi:hypothetical protein